jgi:hypothetical protein
LEYELFAENFPKLSFEVNLHLAANSNDVAAHLVP